MGSECPRVPAVGPAVPSGLAPCGSAVCGGGRWDSKQLGPWRKRSPDEQPSEGRGQLCPVRLAENVAEERRDGIVEYLKR